MLFKNTFLLEVLNFKMHKITQKAIKMQHTKYFLSTFLKQSKNKLISGIH
jgi:hypothetical protein